MAFDAVNAALILSKGVGCPPNDMQSFSATSQEDGIKVTFTGPKNSYVYGAANNDTLLSTPAGVMIRYSDTDYPADINDGTLLGVYNENYNPVNPTEVTDNLIGLVFEQTYYFSAFPFSVDGIYNKSQASANRASCQWVGNKGTINVTVATYEGYTGGEIGEYTITLVDQAESSPSNIERTASGTGLTQIGNLEAGKTYVVTLTDVGGLTCDPSEPITIVAGETYNVTMTFREKYGTISVTVNTANDVHTLGEYTITLLDQSSESPSNIEKQATGKTTTVFENLIAGKQYKVRLGAAQNFIAPADSDTLTVIGGDDVAITMTYSPGLGSVVINVTTNPTGMPIGSYTITLTPTAGGSSLSKTRSGSGSVTFNSVPIGTYNIKGSSINHYTFRGGQVSVTGGQQSSRSVVYAYNATLEQASWTEIDTMNKSGKSKSLWSVGDTKNITVSGETIKMTLIGYNEDTLASGGTASMTFCSYMMSQDRAMDSDHDLQGGYTKASMFNYLNQTVYNALDPTLRNLTKEVVKVVNSGYPWWRKENVNVKVFLFSLNEVTEGGFGVTSGDGKKYSYFNDSRLNRGTTSAGQADWWTRTPQTSFTDDYAWQGIAVNPKGDGDGNYYSRANYANNKLGVVFGFCI